MKIVGADFCKSEKKIHLGAWSSNLTPLSPCPPEPYTLRVLTCIRTGAREQGPSTWMSKIKPGWRGREHTKSVFRALRDIVFFLQDFMTMIQYYRGLRRENIWLKGLTTMSIH